GENRNRDRAACRARLTEPPAHDSLHPKQRRIPGSTRLARPSKAGRHRSEGRTIYRLGSRDQHHDRPRVNHVVHRPCKEPAHSEGPWGNCIAATESEPEQYQLFDTLEYHRDFVTDLEGADRCACMAVECSWHQAGVS